MTVATEKLKQTSRRHTLVRISGRRDIANIATDAGGGLWTYALPEGSASIPFDLWFNDEQFAAKVTGTPADGEWSFDEETRVLTFNISGWTPGTDLVLMSYYLFYASADGGDVAYYENPDDTASTVRNWVGRLTSEPTFQAEIADVTNGVFALANSQFEIANRDSDFEQYLTSNDSFYKRDVIAWLFINGQKQRSFTGKIVSIGLGETISLSVLDSFTRLDSAATMGDTGSNVRIPTTAHPDDIEKPIPLIVARNSFHHRNDSTADFTGATDAGEWVNGTQARCRVYSANLGNTVNRSWRLCRTLANLETQVFGTKTRAIAVDSVSVAFKFTSYSNVRIGDTMKWTEAGTDYYGRIVAVGTFTFSGNTYDIRVLTDTPTISNASTVTPLKCLSVWIEGASGGFQTQFGLIYLEQEKDYSITQTSLSTGNKLISITLTSSVESNHGLSSSSEWVNPGRHRLKFALRTTSVTTGHAAIAKKIVEAAGINTNAATFTQADLDLVENVAFMVPELEETTYPTYKEVLTKLLSSTLGYVRLNNDDEAEYYVTSPPAGGDVKDETLIADRDITVSLEYQDIVSAITPSNKHIPFTDTRSLTQATSARAQLLHGITNEIEFDHYMETQTPSRMDEILSIRAERRVTYEYETATDDIDSLLGQDVTIESRKILGGSGTKNVKITQIQKSAEKVTVTATDLLGLT